MPGVFAPEPEMDKSVAIETVEELLEDSDRIGFYGVETDNLIAVLAPATEMGHKVLVWKTEKWRWMIKINSSK